MHGLQVHRVVMADEQFAHYGIELPLLSLLHPALHHLFAAQRGQGLEPLTKGIGIEHEVFVVFHQQAHTLFYREL